MTYYLYGINKQVKKTVTNINAKYKALTDTHYRKVVFEVGDLVWEILTHDKFLIGKYNKLKERKISICEVL
jgi:hypothetical protein